MAWAENLPELTEPTKTTTVTDSGLLITSIKPKTTECPAIYDHKVILEAQLAKAADPETAKRISLFKKNLYDALLKDGFTHQEAIQIVIATPMPTVFGK